MAPASPEVYAPRRAPRQLLIAARRGRIGLTAWGPESDSPIVLLHGWMDCGAAFQLLVDCLPDDWPLVAVDWPGYGRSDSYEGGYWMPEYLADLEWLLDHLSPGQPARIISHSLGASVATMYAGLRPTRLRWLVNMEGIGLPRLTAAEVPARVVAWLDALAAPTPTRRYGSFDELASALLVRNPRLPPAHAQFLARCWAREVPAGVQMLADVQHQWPSPIRYTPEELDACLARITIPLLLQVSEDSDYLRRMGGDALLVRWRALVSTLQATTVANTGHLLHQEQPAATAAQIVQFVANLR
jgi:pimeloyl-ACP methyl ester carboxylesterase